LIPKRGYYAYVLAWSEPLEKPRILIL